MPNFSLNKVMYLDVSSTLYMLYLNTYRDIPSLGSVMALKKDVGLSEDERSLVARND